MGHGSVFVSRGFGIELRRFRNISWATASDTTFFSPSGVARRSAKAWSTASPGVRVGVGVGVGAGGRGGRGVSTPASSYCRT